MDFTLFAEPWWVNLIILVPFVLFFYWRRKRLNLAYKVLLIVAIFSIAFGFVEAAVVVYLRAAVGLLLNQGGELLSAGSLGSSILQQADFLSKLPYGLILIEIFREVATIIMLVSVAFLAGKKIKERMAIFFWAFAIWDIFYYVGLWLAVRWPESLLTRDVLFLIPVPWFSQVWYPILVSLLMILAVLFSVKTKHLRLKKSR